MKVSAEQRLRLTELGITHRAMSSDDYTAQVAELIEVWKPLIIAAGVTE